MEQKVKIARDYTALLLLCAQEKRLPSTDEKNKILSFNGFGAIASYLLSHDFPKSWTESEKKLHPYITEIYSNIRAYLKITQPNYTDQTIKDAIQNLKLSSLTSYYTPSFITEPLAKYCVEKLNTVFPNKKEFTILEPSAGTGRFIFSLNRNSKDNKLIFTAVEPNIISASSIFEDNTTVFDGGFQQLDTITKEKFDCIIGNIPFGNISVFDSEFKKSKNPAERLSCDKIHNYFFTKASTLLNDGGVLAFITTTAFCTTEGNSIIREKLCQDNNLIANVLLPTNLFEEQNTAVQSSLVIFQKPFEKKSGLSLDENYFVKGENQTSYYFDETLNKSNKFAKEYLYYHLKYLPSLRNNLTNIILKSELNKYQTKNKIESYIEIELKANKPVAQLSLFDTLFNDINKLHQADEENKKTKNTRSLKTQEYKGEFKEHYFENILLTNIEYNNGKPFFLKKDYNTGNYSAEPFVPNDVSIRSANEYNRAIALLTDIRESYHQIIEAETLRSIGAPDERANLNLKYDLFFTKYGSINKAKDITVYFDDKVILNGLEIKNENTGTFEKSDIFYKSLVKNNTQLPQNLSAIDALAYNINYSYKIDFELLETISNLSKEELIINLSGKIYYDAHISNWEIASKFLSGDIITKIDQAESFLKINEPSHEYYAHVRTSLKGLQEIKPTFIEYEEIIMHLGNRWIPIDTYREFAESLFETKVTVEYFNSLDEYIFKADGSNSLIDEVYAAVTYNRKYTGVQMLNFAIVDRFPDAKIYFEQDGKKMSRPDEEGLQNMQMKSDEIKEKFNSFLVSLSPERHQELAVIYNNIYNRTVKFIPDGSFFEFKDLQHYEPRETQKNAVAHIIGNMGGIIDLPVGEGKTLVMVVASYEMKRLGLINKPMIIAMKANVHDIAEAYRLAYPHAKLLYPTEVQTSKGNREILFQQIANNDWDCIILSHDQFKFIPQSRDKQLEILNEEVNSLESDFQILSGDEASKMQLKGLVSRIETQKGKIGYITQSIQKDPHALTFAQMGIDHLFVDESQQFKNLQYSTRHFQIAGLGSPEGSDKAFNLFIASRSLQDNKKSDLNLTFLSGSTIKNSLVELYLLFKYLRPQKMNEIHCPSFDTWAANFAEKSTEFEFDVSGTLKKKDRFRSYANVPELSALYSDITYYMNPKDSKLIKPSINEIPIYLDPTPQQEEYNNLLIEFGRTGNRHLLGLHHLSDKDAYKARMVIACNYGKLMTLDMRIIDENKYIDEPNNKLGAAAENIARIYNKFKEQNGTQFIFCDSATPKKTFNAYNGLKDKLIEHYNIPAEQIRFIHEAKTETQRKDLLNKFKAGDIRILLGSTFKLGTGVNSQDRVVAIHHLDFPWTPEDLNQRNGRGARFGNFIAKNFNNNKVDVYTYATKKTVDIFKAQTLKLKQDFINQIKNNDSTTRRIEEPVMDENSTVSYSEFVAILSGDSSLLDKMKLEMKIQNLERELKQFLTQRNRNHLSITTLQDKIPKIEKLIEHLRSDQQLLVQNEFAKDEFKIEFLKQKFTNLKDFSYFLHSRIYIIEGDSASVSIKNEIFENSENLGKYKGFTISYDKVNGNFILKSQHEIKYKTENGFPSVNIDYTGRYFEMSLQPIERLILKYEKELVKTRQNLALLEKNPIGEWPKLESLNSMKNELKELNLEIERKNSDTNKEAPTNQNQTLGEPDIPYGIVDMSKTIPSNYGLNFGKPMYDFENPIARRTVNNDVYRITDENLINDNHKVYRLYKNTELSAEFFTVDEAKEYVSKNIIQINNNNSNTSVLNEDAPIYQTSHLLTIKNKTMEKSQLELLQDKLKQAEENGFSYVTWKLNHPQKTIDINIYKSMTNASLDADALGSDYKIDSIFSFQLNLKTNPLLNSYEHKLYELNQTPNPSFQNDLLSNQIKTIKLEVTEAKKQKFETVKWKINYSTNQLDYEFLKDYSVLNEKKETSINATNPIYYSIERFEKLINSEIEKIQAICPNIEAITQDLYNTNSRHIKLIFQDIDYMLLPYIAESYEERSAEIPNFLIDQIPNEYLGQKLSANDKKLLIAGYKIDLKNDKSLVFSDTYQLLTKNKSERTFDLKPVLRADCIFEKVNTSDNLKETVKEKDNHQTSHLLTIKNKTVEKSQLELLQDKLKKTEENGFTYVNWRINKSQDNIEIRAYKTLLTASKDPYVDYDLYKTNSIGSLQNELKNNVELQKVFESKNLTVDSKLIESTNKNEITESNSYQHERKLGEEKTKPIIISLAEKGFEGELLKESLINVVTELSSIKDASARRELTLDSNNHVMKLSVDKYAGFISVKNYSLENKLNGLRISSPFKNIDLSAEQMNNYVSGRAIYLENVKFDGKDPINVWVQAGPKNKLLIEGEGTNRKYNIEVVDPKIEMRFFNDKQYKLITRINGVTINDDQLKSLKNGNQIVLTGYSTTSKPYQFAIKADPLNFRMDKEFVNEKNYSIDKPNFRDKINQVLRNIHLPAFLHAKFGYDVHKSGKQFYIKTDTEASKIVVQVDTKYKTGNWIFFDNKNGKTGNIIDYLCTYKNYGPANDADVMKRIMAEVEAFNPHVFSNLPESHNFIPANLKPNYSPVATNTNEKPDLSYIPLQSTEYLNTRGISTTLLESPKYEGVVMNKLHFMDENKSHSFLNTAFLVKNINDEVVDISMKNKGVTSEKSFSGFVKNGQRNEGVVISAVDEVRLGTVRNIVIGEAFIDNLSFTRLNQQFLTNTVDISSEGRLGKPQIDIIQKVIDTHKGTNVLLTSLNVVLINDKDFAGYGYDCSIVAGLNKSEANPPFHFEFKNSSNQMDSFVFIKVLVPDMPSESLLESYKMKLSAISTELSTIKVGNKSIVFSQVNYNEVTKSFDVKGTFAQISKESPNYLAFPRKVYEKCTEIFKADLQNLNIVNMKSEGNDWNEDLMKKQGLTKECIMANSNPYLGMNKIDATNKMNNDLQKGNDVGKGASFEIEMKN